MLFNSIDFLFFFPITILIYFLVPKKIRYIWLLLCSYFFYMCWNFKYVLLLLFSTIVTYTSGILLNKYRISVDSNFAKRRKYIVVGSVILNVGVLAFFKYSNFLIENTNMLFSMINVKVIDNSYDIILPIGISFYTFQALGYTIDVYREKIDAEKNFFRYALFVSFFPQIAAGPIERSQNLLNQIRDIANLKLPKYNRIVEGLILMLWGYFMKIVIADRVAILVNKIFDFYFMYGSVELILGAVGYAFQIYCDFASYSAIAIGAAKVMGFHIMENFNAPYFSKSIKEFWRRWHISLSTWFRDYLYIPLGGNRCSKIRFFFNIMVTFILSGLWHGAAWTYVIWGGLHGFYQVIGTILYPIKEKIALQYNFRTKTITYRLGQGIVTFILVDFAWIFFRSATLKDAIGYIVCLFSRFDPWFLFSEDIFSLGLNRKEFGVLIFAMVILLLGDLVKKIKNLSIDEFVCTQSIGFRYLFVVTISLLIIVCGVYGKSYDASQFIYFQF